MMANRKERAVDIALIHHPVLGKNGETIGSAVTNLDIHDIARIARTYGVERYYIVTPYADQKELVGEIIAHWQDGHGSTYNPARKEAFSLVRTADSLEDVIETVKNRKCVQPVLVATSARDQKKRVSYRDSRKRIDSGEQTLLVFGTAHGLAPEITEKADYTLPAIQGDAEYNHLSVRSAVAVICDRLLSNWKE